MDRKMTEMRLHPPGPHSHLGRLFRNPPADRKECWVWPGPRTDGGYGKTGGGIFGMRTLLAHRATYTWFIGDIPDGLTLDHLCRNPPCVNPWHLEPVTMAENVRRARPHRFGSIRQLPSGRWQARITAQSGKRFSASFDERQEAETWIAADQADGQ